MPRTVTVTLSHDLGKDAARARVEEGARQIIGALGGGVSARLFKVHQEWTGEDQLSFNAKGLGKTIDGTIDVFPAHVRIEATLPNVLAALAELITGRVEKEGRLLLEKRA
ncbi:MAG: polyhydroxyalkanoic acid system family protein [Pseudomonadota bacterium]